MADIQIKYLKDIPAIKLFEIKRIVLTSNSISTAGGAWEELARHTGLTTNEIFTIKACGNNIYQWTENFFNRWLLSLPTLEEAIRAFIASNLEEAIIILEPLCHGEAKRLGQEFLDQAEARRQSAALAYQPLIYQQPGATAQQHNFPQQLHEAGDHVLEYSEYPHGAEAEVAQISAVTSQPQLPSQVMTSCLTPRAQTEEHELVEVNRQQRWAGRSALRISAMPGEFSGLPARRVSLVYNSPEGCEAAALLRDLYQRLFHPQLAPLYGSVAYTGSMDLYFPLYKVSLEDVYVKRKSRDVSQPAYLPPYPLDFDSRLRVLFGIAKALLYLHGSPGGEERLLLGNLAADLVMLDSYSCPVICDLTTLREVPCGSEADFSTDVEAFKTLGLELFTGFSKQRDPVEFGEVFREMIKMKASRQEDRTQIAYDSEPPMLAPEMESNDDEEFPAEPDSKITMMYFMFQVLMCSLLGLDNSLETFAEQMRVIRVFAPVWTSL